MSENIQGQIIQAPNTLRLKVGGRLGAIDPAERSLSLRQCRPL